MTRLSSAVFLFFIYNWVVVAQTDSVFQIYNAKEIKCLSVEYDGKILLSKCNQLTSRQKFRWASRNRIFSVLLKRCLTVNSASNWAGVTLKVCDDTQELQKWQCKNDILVDLKDRKLRLHYKSLNGNMLWVCNDSECTSGWSIYGTTENICSEQQEDVFTTFGNSQGKPCMFPFKYKKKWYSECTTADSSSQQPWCATTTDYDQEQMWGYCPSRSNENWVKNSVTGDFYLVNPSAQLTWHQARMSCRQQGADLLSILEPHEQNFISGLTHSQHMAALLWMGLNSLESGSGWQWVDGRPFRYLNWGPGHPYPAPGQTCVVLNTASASIWESSSCMQLMGYICRRSTSTAIPTSHPVDGNSYKCPKPWVTYRDQCYDLRRSKKAWKEALIDCRKDGGDLASIHSIAEQDFIISQLGYLPTDKLWIGLNDQKIQQLFEWIDGSTVRFTRWELKEPSHQSMMKEDCVLIGGEEGKWADDSCEKDFGFICKKKADANPGGVVTVTPGCKEGWTRHGSFCYLIGSEEKSFEDAKEDCVNKDSHLVDVSDRFENAFLTSLVGLRPEKYFWMGLSNMKHRETFTWTNTRNVRFTHFAAGMPGQKQGCVAMMTGTSAGLWDVLSCSSSEKYICKTLAQGVEPPTAPPTTAPLKCADGWNPLGTRDMCYKVYFKEDKYRKTWFEALDYCKAIGGNLLSIHSENDFLHHSYRLWQQTAWIGLSALDPKSGFVWSDGSSSSFENWDTGEPNNFNGVELCGEIYTFSFKWNDRHCESYNSWICEIRKGVTPNPTSTDIPPVHNKTEDGWIMYNNSEYYINNELLTMDEAREFCQRRNGDLAIINGESERIFLWKVTSVEHSYYWRSGEFYIGLTIDVDLSVQWIDGSPAVFLAWNYNEPGFANYDENCVVMGTSMGFWKNINCGRPMESICKRALGSPPNATLAPPVITGGCSLGWKYFDGKCYRFYGKRVSEKKTWQDARNNCIVKGGSLVSILSTQEQAFLLTETIAMPSDVWIGLNSQNRDSRFLWTDGKRVKYLNWAKEQPKYSPWSDDTEEQETLKCTVLSRHQDNTAGKWKTSKCSESYGFICKMDADPSKPLRPTVPSNTYYDTGNGSVMVVLEKMDWQSAYQHCKKDSASLASIGDIITQAFIHLLVYQVKGPVWIGLNTNETGGIFQWVDKWSFRYTNWASGEPKSDLPCVYVDVDGEWKTDHCNSTYHPVCKTWAGPIPTDSPQLPGTCPDHTWIPFRSHCYLIWSSVYETWGHAVMECNSLGASIASIADPMENNFLHSHLTAQANAHELFWIGLYRNHQGQWVWQDGSVVDYVNWGEGEPRDSSGCVFMNPMTSKWSITLCRNWARYICKMDKVPVVQPSVTPSKIIPQDSSHGYYGLIFSMIALVVVVVGLGFLFFRRKLGTVITVPPSFENMLYVGSHSNHRADTDILVKNMEVNPEGSK